MRPNVIVIASILVSLAVNIVLDAYTDVPMLLRWAVAVGLGLVATFALTKWSKRRQKRNTDDSLDRL